MNIEKRLIPVNYNVGRYGYHPEAIVIHLMDGTLKGTDSWFRNKDAKASTHYGVGVNGEVYQWVEEKDMAWGNGRVDNPTWKGIKPNANPNLYTISIEHEGKSGHFWTGDQYNATAQLVKEIAQRWNIPLDADHVIVHSEIYAKKPSCTGAGFDKAQLLSMLKPQAPEVRNSLVKGDASAAIYWVDNANIAHAIPSWPFFLEFFGGSYRTLPQSAVDALKKGATFKA
jgi:N-acetyl-anhydromuramyl-L-alanine amidase AmpD